MPLTTPTSEVGARQRAYVRPKKWAPDRRRRGVLRRVCRRVVDHECTEVAGEMAFDFSLSIFPAALFTAALVGLLSVTPEWVSRSMDVMGVFVHDAVKAMVEENIRNLVEARSEGVLTVGFLGAVWAASSAVSATIKALNRANEVRETRPFWYRRALSVGLMAGLGMALAISFNLLILGNWIEEQALVWLGLKQVIHPLLVLIKWPLGFLSTVAMVALLYRVAPNCRPCYRSVLPGAVLFAALWFLLSKAFGYYVGSFSYYNRVFGILGVFIVVQLWIYLTALILLVGGELNAALQERRASLS